MPTLDKVPIDRINFGIVLNDCSISSISEPTNLSGWIFQKADADESQICSNQLKKYAALTAMQAPNQQMNITSSGSGHSLIFLNHHSDWRYSVLRPTNTATLNGAKLSEALRLSDANLICELWQVRKSPTSDGPETITGGHPAQCFQYLHRAELEESLTPINLDQLSEVVKLRSDLDEAKFPSIVSAIEMFRDLDINPPTPVKMLGYFSVIESLLSHAPQSNDTVDSITRQLKRNLILLNNRMDTVNNIGLDEFGETKPENVISKLYGYRSAIAHGGDQNSKISALVQIHKEWGNRDERQWPEYFLRRLTKRILVHSMREPQLIIDLKG